MGDKNKGLYGKFAVQRMDGSDQPGGKHHGCEYFVLDLSHDPHAEPALRAYAFACRHEYPLLSDDLREKAQSMRESGVSRGQLRNIDSRVEITLRQALALVDFFGGSDAEITIQYFGPGEMKIELGEECPAGIYAWCSDYPDEGACYLGPTEVADDDSETEIGYFDLVAHLVASANACAGVAAEDFKSGAVMVCGSNQVAYFDKVLQQRDELLVEFAAYKEGSEEAFGAVVAQKKAAEARLESMQTTIDSQQGVICNIRDQRNELLAALEQFLDPDGGPPQDTGEWREVLRVIASVKGGAA